MTPTDYLAELTRTKGEAWVRLLLKWMEMKQQLDEVPPDDRSLVEIVQRRMVQAMTRECCLTGFRGVPTAIYDDAISYRKLVEQELAGDNPPTSLL